MQAVFNRLAAKAPELAAALKGAGNEADRLSLLTQYTGGTLEKMAEQAKAPETVFGRLGKVWDEFMESAGGETFDIGNTILTPLSEAVDWIHENMETIKKIVVDTFNRIREFLSAGWDALSSIFDGFVEGLTPLFDALSELGDEISKLFGGAVDGADSFSAFTSTLREVGQVLGWLVKTVLQTASVAINLLTSAAPWLVEQFRNLKDAFVKFLQSGNPVANFINALWKGFTDLLGSIGGVINKILQFLGLI